jgi:hypothetical protein
MESCRTAQGRTGKLPKQKLMRIYMNCGSQKDKGWMKAAPAGGHAAGQPDAKAKKSSL